MSNAWANEIKERLNGIDRTVPQMARAIFYNEEYIRNVLREGAPNPRVKNAIERYILEEERRRSDTGGFDK